MQWKSRRLTHIVPQGSASLRNREATAERFGLTPPNAYPMPLPRLSTCYQNQRKTHTQFSPKIDGAYSCKLLNAQTKSCPLRKIQGRLFGWLLSICDLFLFPLPPDRCADAG